ncbi:MAG: hypothetical protein C7B43_15140 [Sulfobacillus benefaciens]|uniref:Uncharacterized protein n=1 Tax=Sulfobacillus benefaciens TaxID=453960 RepID=A0A2T2WV23_9FIRM|nr:MAG: hypothetical protein C7B43_15140 [Sulfobacillus benefaciens]
MVLDIIAFTAAATENPTIFQHSLRTCQVQRLLPGIFVGDKKVALGKWPIQGDFSSTAGSYRFVAYNRFKCFEGQIVQWVRDLAFREGTLTVERNPACRSQMCPTRTASASNTPLRAQIRHISS